MNAAAPTLSWQPHVPADCAPSCRLSLAAASAPAVSYGEFLRAIRGKLSPMRRRLVENAFHALDAAGNGDGVLTVDDLRDSYDASKHPDVVAGRLDPHGALRSFLETFEGMSGDGSGMGDGVVTLAEWMSYYEGVSASIDSDDYFATMLAGTWGHLKTAAGKPAVVHVSKSAVDTLEAILYEASYRRKTGSHHSQERLLNDSFKAFDTDGSGTIDKFEFVRAMERFGLAVRGKGRPGIGGLPEEVVIALFDRYDTDGSGTLSFREFSEAFIKRHKMSEPTVSLPAEEYSKPPPSARATPRGEYDDSQLRHPKQKHDPELMSARHATTIGARGAGYGSYLSAAARVHGTQQGSKRNTSGTPFR